MTHHHIVMDEVEFNYIREAVQEKHDRLMEKLVLHKTKPTLEDITKIAEAEFEKELAKISKKKKPFVYKKKAKYGLKKDGTPKKKPGRPRLEAF
jgi:DNA modification methylase